MRRFAKLLPKHGVVHAQMLGWDELANGSLIKAAEGQGFEVMITVDKNLQYQQSLKDRSLSIIVLAPLFVYYENLAPLVPQIENALQDLPKGSFLVIEP